MSNWFNWHMRNAATAALTVLLCSCGPGEVPLDRIHIVGASDKGAFYFNAGKVTQLSELTDAYAVHSDGENVTIAGRCNGQDCLSKNGVVSLLNNFTLSEEPRAMSIIDGKVYLAGTETTTGRMAYWLDGAIHTIGAEGTYGAARAVVVDRGIVLLAGSYAASETSDEVPVIVRDGEIQQLPQASTAFITSLAVLDGIAYACGADATQALCYQSDKKTPYDGQNITDVTAAGGTLYAAGFDLSGACIWTDGRKTNMEEMNESSVAKALAVDDGDIVAVGYYKYGLSRRRAWYWMAGEVSVFLEEEGATAKAVWIQ